MSADDGQGGRGAADDARLNEIRTLMQGWSTEHFAQMGTGPAARSLVADAGLELLDMLQAERDRADDLRGRLAAASAENALLREALERCSDVLVDVTNGQVDAVAVVRTEHAARRLLEAAPSELGQRITAELAERQRLGDALADAVRGSGGIEVYEAYISRICQATEAWRALGRRDGAGE